MAEGSGTNADTAAISLELIRIGTYFWGGGLVGDRNTYGRYWSNSSQNPVNNNAVLVVAGNALGNIDLNKGFGVGVRYPFPSPIFSPEAMG